MDFNSQQYLFLVSGGIAVFSIIGYLLAKLFDRKKPATPPQYISDEVSSIINTPIETQNTDDMKIVSGVSSVIHGGDPTKKAILFGINECNPNVYQGDKLPLRGCVNDSRNVLSYLTKKKFGKVWYNENKDCSIANFLRVWKDATNDLKPGDILLLQMSRHGMSLGDSYMDKDKEGTYKVTEKDDEGKDVKVTYSGDQAAVMYDGVIIDDCFWHLFCSLPKGIKLIYINDSCFSGTQYRVASVPLPGKEKEYRKARGVDKEYLPTKDNVLDVTQLEREFPKPANSDLSCDFIYIGGCQDWQTSADAYLNGKFCGAMTYSLMTALNNIGHQPLKQLRDRTIEVCKTSGFDQIPKFEIIGDQSLWDAPLFQ